MSCRRRNISISSWFSEVFMSTLSSRIMSPVQNPAKWNLLLRLNWLCRRLIMAIAYFTPGAWLKSLTDIIPEYFNVFFNHSSTKWNLHFQICRHGNPSQERRQDSDILESCHTGIRENNIRPRRYCIDLREAQEIIPWKPNVWEHYHQARGQRQECIYLRITEDRSVPGRDDGSRSWNNERVRSPETEGNDTSLLRPWTLSKLISNIMMRSHGWAGLNRGICLFRRD